MTAIGLTATQTGRIDAAISSRLAGASYTAPLDAGSTRSALGMASANLDTQLAALDADVLSRLASASYTAPLTAATTRSALGMAAANLDTQLAAISTLDTAIKAKTDQLGFTVANQVIANIQYVNDVQVVGTGASGNEWGPA
jgi:hypothetical protein